MNRLACAWVLVCGAALCFTACKHTGTGQAVETIETLRHPSIHIMVDNTRPLPRSGSFVWGMSYFQIDPALKVDHAVLDQRLHAALEAEFAKRHFALNERGAEYLVGYAVAGGSGIDAQALNAAYGTDLAMPPAEKGAHLQYQQGVLIVDVLAKSTKRLLWRGAIKAEVEMNVSEDQKQQRIRSAVAALLSHFPQP